METQKTFLFQIINPRILGLGGIFFPHDRSAAAHLQILSGNPEDVVHVRTRLVLALGPRLLLEAAGPGALGRVVLHGRALRAPPVHRVQAPSFKSGSHRRLAQSFYVKFASSFTSSLTSVNRRLKFNNRQFSAKTRIESITIKVDIKVFIDLLPGANPMKHLLTKITSI